MLLNSCVPFSGTAFTYIGQSFGYDALRPGFLVSAMNALPTPTITQNYTGPWAKLSDASVSLSELKEDSSQVGSDTATLMAVSYTPDDNPYNITDNGDGTLDFEFGDDEFVYDKDANSEISEFSSDVNLEVTALVDSDEVSTTEAFTLSPEPVRLRFGRISMSNVFGSELIGLQMPMVTEYFFNGLVDVDGSPDGFYQVNENDTCTTFANHDVIVVADNLSIPGSSTIMLDNTTVVAGVFSISLSAPGGGITGQIDLSAKLYAGAIDNQWLQYDWYGDGGAMTIPRLVRPLVSLAAMT
jgi:MSHA biogenesis protein MshQ